MPDLISELRSAGFQDDEIAAWTTKTRVELTGAGFSDEEIDDYFGQPKTPKGVQTALVDRVLKGAAFCASCWKECGGVRFTAEFFDDVRPPNATVQ
jgi:hypothetical protein